MPNKKSTNASAAKAPEQKTGPGKRKKFLWPFGVMIAMAAAIAALLIYLAIQTYRPEAAPVAGKAESAQGPKAASPAGAAGGEAAGEESPEANVAIANGVPISQKTFTDMLTMSQNQRLSSGQSQEGEEPSMDLKLEVLNSLVTMTVAVKEAYDLGFGPSELEVESAINQMVGEYGTREAFENALPAFGTDLGTLRKQVADNLALRAWRDTAFIKDALATDEEVKEFYEEHMENATHADQVRAVRIMLPVPLTSGQEDPQSKAVIKQRAETVYQEALAGTNFDELVERYMDPATRSATQGGQMGWVSRGALDFSALENVLFSLKPGEVAPPVEDQFSFHIVKVIETRPAGVMTYEELKPEIMEYLLTVKTERLFLLALREIREKAEVEVLDGPMNEAWPAFMAKLSAQPMPGPDAPPPPTEAAGDGETAPETDSTAGADTPETPGAAPADPGAGSPAEGD
ncbi:MAG: peptidylprolyl isomerase [Deltaproteobacteria bacterium]|jgi:peptidyl-prolyl cis-trans isomerase C|nr:peptidylprolyl isomerase [Deltaproteobacteria bacterium]